MRKKKQMKRKSLKGRILLSISVIFIFSMTVSTILGYLYFMQIVRNQSVEEEKNRIMQASSQLSFMSEDIRRFAESMLIDEKLQELLDTENEENAFEVQSRYTKVVKRMVFYNNLRTYIEGSILEMEDGSLYGSSYNFKDVSYLEEKLQQKDIQNYMEQQEWIYSDSYYDSNTGSNERKICYAVPMYDKRNFGKLKATLYLELKLEYFLEQVKFYGERMEHIALVGNGKDILYQQDQNHILSKVMQDQTLETEGVYHTKEGYLICTKVEGTGWKLCTIVTNHHLLKNSLFVLFFFVASFLASVFLVLIVVSRIVENILRPVEQLSEQMEEIEYGKQQPVEIVHTGDEIETLYERFYDMMAELDKKEQARIAYEKQKRDMEYDITLSQINPHYIYNVLNTVVYLSAAEKNQDVVKIVHSLIYTLHETLKVGEENVETTIEKELELTKCYLEIQRYRYPEMFEVETICEEGLKDCRVPKTMIQPLVENAILHGILPTEEKGKIQILIESQEDILQITVSDNGVGISKEQLDRFACGETMGENKTRKHIGVENVRDRIRYLYGETYGMEIKSSEGKGTDICLTLPIKREEGR